MFPLGLRFVGHSTVRADRADVDLVVLSHLHGDHLHLPSLRLLSPHVRVIAPRGSRDWGPRSTRGPQAKAMGQ